MLIVAFLGPVFIFARSRAALFAALFSGVSGSFLIFLRILSVAPIRVLSDPDVGDIILVDIAVFHSHKDFAGQQIAVCHPAGTVRGFAILAFFGHTFSKFGVAVMLIFEAALESPAGA